MLAAVEIEDIGRFKDVGKLHAYAGNIPSTHSSGERSYHGKVVKEGNRWLRWAAVEAVWPALRADFGLRCFYERMKMRKGANSAKVATARRLLTIIYRSAAFGNFLSPGDAACRAGCPGRPEDPRASTEGSSGPEGPDSEGLSAGLRRSGPRRDRACSGHASDKPFPAIRGLCRSPRPGYRASQSARARHMSSASAPPGFPPRAAARRGSRSP
ncbi:MAG TPA: transposase [Acidobacteriota bacterium]